jgi:hypothetical protein
VVELLLSKCEAEFKPQYWKKKKKVNWCRLSVAPTNLYFEIPIPTVVNIRRLGLWEVIGSERGALVTGISALLRGQRASLIFPPCENMKQSQSGSGPSMLLDCAYPDVL